MRAFYLICCDYQNINCRISNLAVDVEEAAVTVAALGAVGAAAAAAAGASASTLSAMPPGSAPSGVPQPGAGSNTIYMFMVVINIQCN